MHISDSTFGYDDRMAYQRWQAASQEVFTQLTLDIPFGFSGLPARRAKQINCALRNATDFEAGEISYAKFMQALSYFQMMIKPAVFVVTDAIIKPHDWDRRPELRKSSLRGIVHSVSGVAMTNSNGHKPGAIQTAAHEMFHLLGFRGHHENYDVKDYPKEDCVMTPNSTTTRLCQRDRAALISFWKGVEETLDRRFLIYA